MPTLCTQRLNFYAPEFKIAQLNRLSKRMGLSKSEILRRALDDYLEEHYFESITVRKPTTTAGTTAGGTSE